MARDEADMVQPTRRLPYMFARRHGVALKGESAGGPEVVMREDADPAALIELRRFLGREYKVSRASPRAFDRLLSELYAVGTEAAADAAFAADGISALSASLPSADDLLDPSDGAPAIRLINGIIADAARQGVSDIHIEPYDSELVVRMRVDGVLRETLRMPAHVAPILVSRIKVMARLDIAERRLPQDGRMGLSLGQKMIDVRVSTLPSRAGERVVLRILDKENAGISLDSLGMPPAIERLYREALTQPNGIILVTGPTGSGKTTTLYAGLKVLDDGQRNILTVEDPIEYAVDGVGQTQINPQVGLTFAAGLRAILRQDPDIVMVGEIRDRETAEIAVQAALTGHLVLSTVHTNDAVGAITRLRDMKVEPFLIASTMRMVIAQRLVRRLCETCRRPVAVEPSLSALFEIDPGAVVHEPRGCENCSGTGYRGRSGLFEGLRVDEPVRALINRQAPEDAISAEGLGGFPTLADEARRLVLEGVTSPEEAIRVARRSEDDD